MPSKKHIASTWYAVSDFLMAALAWSSFYLARKQILHEGLTVDSKFWLGIIIIPLGWVILYGLVGSYNSIYRKSRHKLKRNNNSFFRNYSGWKTCCGKRRRSRRSQR